MDRRYYYKGQYVFSEELRAGFDGAENADWRMQGDNGIVGIVTGASVSQHSPVANLSVDVTAGAIYDQQGRRVAIPALQVVDLSVDSLGAATTVVTPGNSKIVSIYARFKRALSDPRIDADSLTQQFVQDESFELVVVQSAEALSPTPPALLADGILLADVTRTQGQTQILTAQIALTGRRQDAFVITSGSVTVRAGTAKGAITAALSSSAAMVYTGGPNWADNTTNPATTVGGQLTKIITDLASVTANSGADKIGCEAQNSTAGGISLPAETLTTRIQRLLDANIGVPAKTWSVPGKAIAASGINTQLGQLVTDLSLQTASDDGARLIGAQAVSQTPTSLGQGSIRSQLTELLTAVNARALLNVGARAWALVELDGAGNRTILKNVGFSTITITPGQQYVTATLTTARADANYGATADDATQNATGFRHARCSFRTTSSFRVFWYDTAHAALDPNSTPGILFIQVFDT